MDQKQTYGRPHPGKSVKVAYTGTAGTTTALPETCDAVRVVSTTDCFIEIGLNPTAVADTGLYLPALVPEYFQCPPNGKVSAIQVASGGTIYCTPM